MRRCVWCVMVVCCVVTGMLGSARAMAQNADGAARETATADGGWLAGFAEPTAVMEAIAGDDTLETAGRRSAALRHVRQLIQVLQARHGGDAAAVAALRSRYEEARADHDAASRQRFGEAAFVAAADAAYVDEAFQLSVYERVFSAAWREKWLEPIVAQERATLQRDRWRGMLASTPGTMMARMGIGGGLVVIGLVGWIITWRPTRQASDDAMRLTGRRAGRLEYVTGLVEADKRYTVIERTTTTTHQPSGAPTTTTSTTTTQHREFALRLAAGGVRSFHFTDFDVPMHAGEVMSLIWPARKRYAEGGAGVLMAVNHTRQEEYWRPSRVMRLVRAPQWPVWVTAIGLAVVVPQMGWTVGLAVLAGGIVAQQVVSRSRRRAFMKSAGTRLKEHFAAIGAAYGGGVARS